MEVSRVVRIHGYRGDLITTTVFQLLQWKHALKLEIASGLTFKGDRKVSTFLRGKLKTPRAYPAKLILAHVSDSLDSVVDQLGNPTDHDEAAMAARRTQPHA
jgi:hypothetical protein